MGLKSGRCAVSARRLRPHHLTHDDEYGEAVLRVSESRPTTVLSDISDDERGECLRSPSVDGNSSSMSLSRGRRSPRYPGDGEREGVGELASLPRRAASRQSNRASISGEPSLRVIYLPWKP